MNSSAFALQAPKSSSNATGDTEAVAKEATGSGCDIAAAAKDTATGLGSTAQTYAGMMTDDLKPAATPAKDAASSLVKVIKVRISKA